MQALLTVEVQPHLALHQRAVIVTPPDRRLAEAAEGLEVHDWIKLLLHSPDHLQALGEVLTVAAEDQVDRQLGIGLDRVVEALHRRLHRVGHVIDAGTGAFELAQLAAAGGDEHGIGYFGAIMDAFHVGGHEQRIVVAVSDEAIGPHPADFGQRFVGNHVTVTGDHQIGFERLHGLEQALVGLVLAQITDAERRFERRYITVAEALYQMIVLDQSVGQLLSPADTGMAVALELLVGDVKNSHMKAKS